MTPSPKKIAVPKMPTSSSRGAAGAVLHRLRGQRQHRDQAAFAVVVGAQDQHHVLERHDHGQRPEHQRQDAQDVLGVSGTRPCANTSFSAYSGLVPMSP
jgi:hypothetical protein